MTSLLQATLVVIAVPLAALGLIEFANYPLALLAEVRQLRQRRSRRGAGSQRIDFCPLVSIVVPAFNEGVVLVPCIESVLADRYANKELLLVDDGSTDDTLAVMRRYEHHPEVIVLTQGNRGKGAALNTGIDYASGDLYFFVDADGVFTANTIETMLSAFDDERVGGVCGNDEPVNLDRHQTRMLALLTHGTALVRRALAHIGCLTIVSGNCGAFRREVVEEVNGFAEGKLGEDLELTWRVLAAGHRINFAPRALVYAEVPNTIHGLWKQRVRWTRGLIETARQHRGLVGNCRVGRFGLYLVYNLVTMLLVPVLQLLMLLIFVTLAILGEAPISVGVATIAVWFGLGLTVVHVTVAVLLDRAWRDLKYLYLLPVVALYSMLIGVVTVKALWLEARNSPKQWNKLSRSGVARHHHAASPSRRDR